MALGKRRTPRRPSAEAPRASSPVASQATSQVERLYRSHWSKLVATAEWALGAHTQSYAQDVVAEAIADMGYGRFPALPDTDADAARFIAGVIRQRARHVNRDMARVAGLSDDVCNNEPSDAWTHAARILLARDVEEALGRLTPRERQVATLHWLQCWTGPQIATALDISVCTVKELLRRAGRKLRAQLECYAQVNAK